MKSPDFRPAIFVFAVDLASEMSMTGHFEV